MQTFLPFPDFKKTAQTLDWRRLGKQRVECWQILRTLLGESQGWRNHPAVLMWKGYEVALCYYGLTICQEWINMGYKDTMTARFRDMLSNLPEDQFYEAPSWLGQQDFHESHQSNLIRKDPDYYSARFPGTPDNLPYIWPE